jgi:hypothetical protein
MSRMKNRSGFSLIEVCLASVILVLGIVGAQQVNSYAQRSLTALQLNSQVSGEHKSLLNLVGSIPLSEAQSTLVDTPNGCLPHPFDSYQKFKSGSDKCEPYQPGFVRSKWEDLSNSYFGYVMQISNTTDASLNSVLGSGYYQNSLLPKLQNNGCISCHKSGAASGSFASFTDVTQPAAAGTNNPKIAPLGLGSPMGRRLLRPLMRFKSLRNIPQVTHTLQFSGVRRTINSNPDNSFEWACIVGKTDNYTRNQAGACGGCPGGGVVLTNASSWQCVNNPSTGKKGHSGCTMYCYWQCGYPRIPNSMLTSATLPGGGGIETNNTYCKHGVVKPTSVLWPNINNNPNPCLTRYPASGSYAIPYTYYECYDPSNSTSQKTQSRWEISYILTTEWTSADGIQRTTTSSGVLK